MTIDAIENNTLVITPTGHEGRVEVTRRERKLISDGKLKEVRVRGTGGVSRTYDLDELTTAEECPVNVGTEGHCAWGNDMSGFERENRYMVIKRSDIRGLKCLIKPEAFSAFETIEKYANQMRINNGKPPLVCVVVESDWPEYEQTWKAIESRMKGEPSEIEALQAQLKQANSKIKELEEYKYMYEGLCK